MAATLKVNTTELQRVASEYNTISGQVGQITTEMLNMVKTLPTCWTGEAADTFISKANALEGDMMRVKALIQQHERELTDVAGVMDTGENVVIGNNAAMTSSVLE